MPLIVNPLLVGIFLFLAYGISIRKLGIYWDDWAYLWTKFELGTPGIIRHFSFSRPLAGFIQNWIMSLTGAQPFAIQLYSLVMRLICSSLVGVLVHRVYPDNLFASISAACLFSLYPGFSMQPIALNFGFSYLLMSLLILSFLLTLKALESPSRRLIYTVFAFVLSAVNLFASEYFFLLELIRPLLVWAYLSNRTDSPRPKLKNIPRICLPFLILFSAAVLYRVFFNPTQTLHYDFTLLDALKKYPVNTFRAYLTAVFNDLTAVLFGAWALPFSLPDPAQLGSRTVLLFWGCVGIAFFALLAVFVWLRRRARTRSACGARSMFLIGIAALFLAGQPFWLTGSYLSFVFPNSRYTLSFLLGMTFFLTAVLTLIARRRTGRNIAVGLLALMTAFSVGYHFRIATEYRRDWNLTANFFQQLKWRVPSLKEDTVVITNVLPIRFSTDNSLTAPLNWIYAQAYAPERMPFMLYTNTKRAETLSKFQAGKKIEQEYLSARFEGNTENAVSLYFQNPGCLHILDPQVDVFNQTIPLIDREAALLNNYNRIDNMEVGDPVVNQFFGSNPGNSWCWYYQKADLARQFGDWERVAQLGDEAFALEDYPNDAMERIPFIEGYAHTGQWEKAGALSDEMMDISPLYNDPLCALWKRINRTTAASAAREVTFASVWEKLDCQFLVN